MPDAYAEYLKNERKKHYRNYRYKLKFIRLVRYLEKKNNYIKELEIEVKHLKSICKQKYLRLRSIPVVKEGCF